MIEKYLKLFKKKKFLFVISFSFLTTVIFLNALFDFSERLINNPTLMLFALLVFYFLVWVSIKRKIWRSKNGFR